VAFGLNPGGAATIVAPGILYDSEAQ
jgi:hypothetical protein